MVSPTLKRVEGRGLVIVTTGARLPASIVVVALPVSPWRSRTVNLADGDPLIPSQEVL